MKEATKERPILFSAPMVRAILDGRKTQTRRVVKPKYPKVTLPKMIHGDWPIGHRTIARPGDYAATMNQYGAVSVKVGESLLGVKPDEFEWLSPYGKPDDLLWVKETWTGTWHPTATSPDNMHLHYAADGSERFMSAPDGYVLPKAAEKCGNFVTPLFMPRWASRITLEITEVRVERLQEISEADCVAEGVSLLKTNCDGECGMTPCGISRQPYISLWNSINGAGGWDANPWVWALTFKSVTA